MRPTANESAVQVATTMCRLLRLQFGLRAEITGYAGTLCTRHPFSDRYENPVQHHHGNR